MVTVLKPSWVTFEAAVKSSPAVTAKIYVDMELGQRKKRSARLGYA